jgi:hypothetical protein
MAAGAQATEADAITQEAAIFSSADAMREDHDASLAYYVQYS